MDRPAPAPATEPIPPPRRAWALWGLIAALVFAAYVPAMRSGFVWDDDFYVTNNPLLTEPDGLSRIWFSTASPSQYFPLTYTTFRWERRLWGLRPAGYHAVNVALHAANAGLAGACLSALAVPGAWFAAAVFALHPVHVESVAWITERKNVLSGFFYLLALLLWIRFLAAPPGRGRALFAAALAAHLLALFSKTTACTLPAALVLAAWRREGTVSRARWVQVVPFVLLGLAMGSVTVWWEHHVLSAVQEGEAVVLPWASRWVVAARALWFHLGKLAWPSGLCFSYPRWAVDSPGPASYMWVASWAAVALVLWRFRVRAGATIAALLFFAANLSPLLGFVPLYTFRYTFVADHYQYLASLGPIALFAAAAVTFARRSGEAARRFARPAGGALLVLLAGLVWRQSLAYKDLETLWRDTLAKNPSSWLAANNLGVILSERGDYGPAVGLFEEALRLNPRHLEAYNNLGVALARQSRFDEAIESYEAALRVEPTALSHYNIGVNFARQGRWDEAADRYRRALAIKPDHPLALLNLGVSLAKLGRWEEAEGTLRRAVAVEPRRAQGHLELGVVLEKAGRPTEALESFARAEAADPALAEAPYFAGIVSARRGDRSGVLRAVARLRELRRDDLADALSAAPRPAGKR
jgi:tetratricopeptide (TPR) repeat protein